MLILGALCGLAAIAGWIYRSHKIDQKRRRK